MPINNTHCCDPVILPTNCAPKCEQLVDACCVMHDSTIEHPNALPCILGNVASYPKSQCEINKAINDKLCCVTWTDITLGQTGWATLKSLQSTVQALQYSSTQNCTVRLRGAVYKNLVSGNTTELLFTLPAEATPLFTRLLSVAPVGNNTAGLGFYISVLGLSEGVNAGQVSIFIPNLFSPGNVTISLDGLTFETN